MAKQANHLQAALAVFWSFFGIRKQRDYAADTQNLKPAHVIIAGLIGAVIFVASMLLVVLFSHSIFVISNQARERGENNERGKHRSILPA